MKTLAFTTSGFGGLSAFGFRSTPARGVQTLIERPVLDWCVSQGILPRMARLRAWPHWGGLDLAAVLTEVTRGWDCGLLQSRHRAWRGLGLTPGGAGTEAESAATSTGPAALGVPVLRAPLGVADGVFDELRAALGSTRV